MVVTIDEFDFGLVYVDMVVRAENYCSRCRQRSKWEWALLTTCDDIGYVIMARATATFPFS